MDNQLHKRKRESINLQKSSTCLLKVNNENAVPKSSTYGFVSHFCSDEEELLRSHNFNLSTTIGLRKHTRKTNRELSAEHKASHKKQCERIGCADAYSNNNESKTIKADKLTLETRCAPDRFCSFVGNLSEDKKNAIRDIGFGSLLEIQCGRLRRQLCRWLVDQFKPECNIIELHGQNLKLCHRTFSDVMGVKDGGIPIQLGGPSENIAELRDIFQLTVKGINIKTLEDIIKQEDKTSWIFKHFYLHNVAYNCIQPDGTKTLVTFWKESMVKRFMK
ncbi:hypothetical protein WN943_027562 [Citrus x changshan-huyou]